MLQIIKGNRDMLDIIFHQNICFDPSLGLAGIRDHNIMGFLNIKKKNYLLITLIPALICSSDKVN